jgi:hypothetical protein
VVLVGGAGVEPTSPPPEPPPPQADKLNSARVAADPKSAFAIHTLSQIVRFAQFSLTLCSLEILSLC